MSLVNLASPAGLTSPNLENLTTTANAAERYTYVENGTAEALAHILISSGLMASTTVGYAHYAADFPLIDSTDATTALDASTHDARLAYVTVPYLTTLTLTCSLNPSYLGESVTFTATATSTLGTPSGTVTFYAGTTVLGTGTLSATTIRSGSVGTGVATFTTTGLTVGSHTIKASYAGDASHESTTATVTQAVLVDLSAGNALAC